MHKKSANSLVGYLKICYICKTMLRKLTYYFLIAVAVVMLGTSCGGNRLQGKRCVLPDSVELRAGDVVFRLGGGLESHAVLALDRDGDYSHVGIVVDTMGKKMIVHAVPGEPDFKGDVDRVKLDPIEKYFSSVYALRGAVLRLSDSTTARRASEVALAVFRRGVLFDGDYDMNDTTRMYCTEMVEYAYSRAGLKLISEEPEHVELPLVHADVYYPSSVYHSKHLKPISIF